MFLSQLFCIVFTIKKRTGSNRIRYNNIIIISLTCANIREFEGVELHVLIWHDHLYINHIIMLT